MNIDRKKNQGGLDIAIHRVKFCLDQIEKSNKFTYNLDMDSDIVSRCTIEEILGTLVSAEQILLEMLEDRKRDYP